MDHPRIERDSVLERYLLGQLSGDEEVAFEEHLLGCARCLAELDEAEDFQRSLRAAVAEEAVRAAVGSGVRGWLRRRGAWLAAALLLVLPPSYLLWRTQRLAVDVAGLRAAVTAPRADTALVFLAATRGGEDPEAPPVNQIRRPQPPRWLVLAMELANAGDFETYRVVLQDARGETLWEQSGLLPDARGTLTLSLHSSFLSSLPPGDYALELSGRERGEALPVAHYRVRFF